VFEGFFLSQIIFHNSSFCFKIFCLYFEPFAFNFQASHRQVQWNGKQNTAKVLGEKTNFFTIIRDPKLAKVLVAFFFSFFLASFLPPLRGKKLLSDLARLLALQFLKLFVFFVSFLPKNCFETYFFFFLLLPLKHQKVVMLVKTFKNVITIFNSKLVHGDVKNDVAVKRSD